MYVNRFLIVFPRTSASLSHIGIADFSLYHYVSAHVSAMICSTPPSTSFASYITMWKTFSAKLNSSDTLPVRSSFFCSPAKIVSLGKLGFSPSVPMINILLCEWPLSLSYTHTLLFSLQSQFRAHGTTDFII